MNLYTHAAKHDRPAFLELRRQHQKQLKGLPKQLTKVSAAEIEAMIARRPGRDRPPIHVWKSQAFLVQQFHEGEHVRLTISRTEIQNDGQWKDGITWDEINECKRQCGYADAWAIEIFPPTSHLVNVANMRHLWLVEQPRQAWIAGTTRPD